MKTILITLDSLNRHHLSLYESDGVVMSSLDELADKGCVFDNHFTGSAPCMPARRELMTGTLELRHRSWGPLEPFDRPLPERLAELDCPSSLITDHYHYFERGGENYHFPFTGYEFIRGHENDNWKAFTVTRRNLHPLTHTSENQERNRSVISCAADFPSARVFDLACNWAAENKDTEDFFLYIDEFDPHEPFSVPDEYLSRVEEEPYEGPVLEWPKYGEWEGNEAETTHLRNRYRAKLMFLDDLLSRFFDALKAHGLYEDTTIIVSTDHGHYLGDHGFVGKPPCDNFNTLFHIPMVVKPAVSIGAATGTRVQGLTTSADTFATICDLHGAPIERPIYGRSYKKLLSDPALTIRDYVLYGYYGAQLGLCDGKNTFLKSPVPENQPLYYYSTRLSGHPGEATEILQQAFADAAEREIGPFIPETDYPVMRFAMPQPPLHSPLKWKSSDAIYDHTTDEEQEHPIRDEALLEEYRTKLARAMVQERFPDEQFTRLGLKKV